MLAIADALVRRGDKPKRTIVFAAFGAEEDGMIGSYYFAAHAPAAVPIDKMVEDLNLDMVGSYDSKSWVAAMGTFKGMPSRTIIDPLVSKANKAGLDVIPGGVSRGSDFEPFCKKGVPYVFLWTPDEKCYHETCDTLEHIDKKHFAQITKFAADFLDALVATDLDLVAARAKKGCGV
jgi:Zn-dependent M28 family amino/carboxypeptidase